MGRREFREGRRRGHRGAALVVSLLIFIAAVIGFFVWRGSVDVFSPVGTIGRQERSLILLALGLSLIVVLPVFILTFSIAWRYRATNTRARYSPDWDHNGAIEFVWWMIPCLLIFFLATVAWQSSHRLDPFQPVKATKPSLDVEVVALDWRWLFIYPQQEVAAINDVTFPVGTPVRFYITSDAPMNSFWIPKLGGQVYAMSGMSTQLNLIANQAGTYRGVSANISGDGFAGMHFDAHAVSDAQFAAWLKQAKTDPALDASSYRTLAAPSHNTSVQRFKLTDPNLYSQIIDKYMHGGEK